VRSFGSRNCQESKCFVVVRIPRRSRGFLDSPIEIFLSDLHWSLREKGDNIKDCMIEKGIPFLGSRGLRGRDPTEI